MSEIDDESLPRRRTRLAGPAAQAKELAEATARLAARRQRDALPHRIETPRLVLRAPIRGDVPDLVKLADNRKIFEVLARLPHPYTRADAIGFIEIIAQRPDERPYAITLDDSFIGIVGFTFREGAPPSSFPRKREPSDSWQCQMDSRFRGNDGKGEADHSSPGAAIRLCRMPQAK